MKKLVMAVLALAVVAVVALAEGWEIRKIEPLFSAQALTTNATSRAIDLTKLQPHGYYSLQVAVTGTGTLSYAQCEATLDPDGAASTSWVPVAVSYVSGGSAVVSNRFFETYTTNSGPNSDGVDLLQVGPPLARQIRFKIVGTGGTTTNTLKLVVQ